MAIGPSTLEKFLIKKKTRNTLWAISATAFGSSATSVILLVGSTLVIIENVPKVGA